VHRLKEAATMFGCEIDTAVARLADALRARGERLATAESCTGGLIAAACTSIAGSSDWFERGFVTYSNEAKVEMLGVDVDLIARHGAVSEEVVRAMAQGALSRSRATWSIAVSGVAGPGGGTAAKPVGLVWIAWAGPQGLARAESRTWPGDRSAVRVASVARALGVMVEALAAYP
jgi:nicotinamide-nucleotide amidase